MKRKQELIIKEKKRTNISKYKEQSVNHSTKAVKTNRHCQGFIIPIHNGNKSRFFIYQSIVAYITITRKNIVVVY